MAKQNNYGQLHKLFSTKHGGHQQKNNKNTN